MSNVYDMATRLKSELQGSGEPPDNGGMEQRVAKLESLAEKTGERLTAIERDVAIIKSNYATKEDIAALRGEIAGLRGDMVGLRGETKGFVAEAKNSIIMWVVSAIFLAQLLPALLKKLGL